MKKNRLAAVYQFDFTLFGIVSTVKEYKLAWSLNQFKLFHLIKAEDIKIEFTDNKSIRVSNLIYEDDYSYVHLLKNRLVASAAAPAQYLIPELSRFDFLLKVNNQTDDRWVAQVYDILRDVNTADYVTKIEVEKIKQKENLLF